MKFGEDENGPSTWFIDCVPHSFLAHGISTNMVTSGRSSEWREEHPFS